MTDDPAGTRFLPAVTALLVDQLGIAPEAVTTAARFDADLRCDSLDVVEMAITAEERFGVMIEDRELEALSTVADLLALLATKDAAVPPARIEDPDQEALPL